MTDHGSTQAETVMREYYAGRLRDRGGHPIKDVARAKAVAMSETRAAKERGTSVRTFKGHTRRRPKLKKE